jgi:Rrf2 family iron-sulfur cluster assembly transcriptional regulator
MEVRNLKISTKGRYALRVMIDLAEHDSGAYIPLKEIAERQEISEKYAEAIISVLVKADVLRGVRGKGGGYKLAHPPESYTVGRILKLTENGLAPVSCLESSPNRCPRAAECKTLPMWTELGRRIDEYLESVTIADLAFGDAAADSYMI